MSTECSQHSHTEGDVSCGGNWEAEEQFVGNAGGEEFCWGWGHCGTSHAGRARLDQAPTTVRVSGVGEKGGPSAGKVEGTGI